MFYSFPTIKQNVKGVIALISISIKDLSWWPQRYRCNSLPVRAWIFFRSYFYYYFSSVHSYEDRLYLFLHRSARIWFSYISRRKGVITLISISILLVTTISQQSLILNWNKQSRENYGICFVRMSRSVYFATHIILEKLIQGLKLPFQMNTQTYSLIIFVKALNHLHGITLIRFL